MSIFRIDKFIVSERSNGYTNISMDIVACGNITAETLNELRNLIEGRDSDWCQTYAFFGRGNGRTKYFSDCARYALTTTDRFEIKKVIFNSPATIVFWADGTKTVVKCQDGDEFSPETGIAMCFMKKALGNKSNFNNTFKKHAPAVMVDKQLDSANNGKKKSTKTYAHLDTETIYRILRENKSSAAELAKSVGVDISTIYYWLRGGGIKKRNISKLIKVLHVSEEVIIKEEN